MQTIRRSAGAARSAAWACGWDWDCAGDGIAVRPTGVAAEADMAEMA
ncbi:unnamed protein product [Ciceribacter selenitireducens ATCC BAA-1503]|uniref:Uncharacterized protein n=1 Tax=Ciceribacter selenitireducens ATCC BAA-1503 TaxID=1336235 RepID=A0A376ADW1_9HYPH|nr:unnamed protein product [Ciceribacter selenitireducens ATCC BAA-1503]